MDVIKLIWIYVFNLILVQITGNKLNISQCCKKLNWIWGMDVNVIYAMERNDS